MIGLALILLEVFIIPGFGIPMYSGNRFTHCGHHVAGLLLLLEVVSLVRASSGGIQHRQRRLSLRKGS